MKRLTYRDANGEAWYSDVGTERDRLHRLASIEDILGDEYDLDRLRELAWADKEGRCKIVPCKLGEPIYLLKSGEIIRNYGVQWHFTDHDEQTFGTLSLYGEFVTDNDFGKTVFLTRAEAEAEKLRDQDG